jgi:hypothetical protein
MTAHVFTPAPITSRDDALQLVRRVIATLDQSDLEPVVTAMLTDGHKVALSVMAIAQAEPDLLTQFLVIAKDAGFLTEAECDALDDDFMYAKRRHGEASPEEIIRALARQHGVTAERTSTDEWADAITTLAGDEVVHDEIEDLVVTLRRKGFITADRATTLYGDYLASA